MFTLVLTLEAVEAGVAGRHRKGAVVVVSSR